MAKKTYRAKSFRINIIGVADLNPTFETDDPEIQGVIEGSHWFSGGTIDIIKGAKAKEPQLSAPEPEVTVDLDADVDAASDYSKHLASLHISKLRSMATEAGHELPKKGVTKKYLIGLLGG